MYKEEEEKAERTKQRASSTALDFNLFNAHLLAGVADDLTDSVLEAMELHGKDIGQGEGFRFHVESLSSLFHQLLPVTLTQGLVLEVYEEGQRVTELLHLEVKGRTQRQAPHVLVQLAVHLHVAIDAILQQLNVQVRPQSRGPLVTCFLTTKIATNGSFGSSIIAFSKIPVKSRVSCHSFW